MFFRDYVGGLRMPSQGLNILLETQKLLGGRGCYGEYGERQAHQAITP